LSHRLLLVGIFVVGILFIPNLKLNAATLSTASMSVSDPRPNGTANYTFTGSSVTTGGPGLIRCIKQVYADPLTGLAPAGMNTVGAGVTLDAAGSNFVPTPGSWTFTHGVQGTLTWTLAGGETPASASARTWKINGVTNSSVSTSLRLQFTTYANVDCSTSPVDNVSVLFILTNASTLSLIVDNTLTFTVNGVASGQPCNGAVGGATATSFPTTIPFGTVTSAANAVVCQDLIASTNATNGYTIYARYTAAPTNALGQTILPHSGSNIAPTAFSAAGTEAYGYTTNDATLAGVNPTANRFTSPAQGWAAMTTTNAELAFEPAGVTSTTYRIGHQAGVSLTTRPGTYTTTVIYTCTPIY
jgi:hypothetical protein